MASDSWLHQAYVASVADGLVIILDTRTGRVLGAVRVGGMPALIAVGRQDNQVLVALENFPGKGTTPGGVVFFPANLTPARVPATKICAAEGTPFTLGGYTSVSAS